MTGLGLCVPAGPGVAAAFDAALAGVSPVGPGPAAGWPASPVTGFDPVTVVDRKKSLKLMGPNMQFALGAGREAWADAGLPPEAARDTGTVLGVRVRPGDYEELVKVAELSLADGAFSPSRFASEAVEAIFPLSMLRNLPNLVTAQVTIQMSLKGFTDSLTSGEASGLQALIEGTDAIARGDADVVLAGGADDLLDPFSLGVAVAAQERTVGATRVPMGQGAAMLVLEEAAHARDRGARVLAEVAGIGEGFESRSPGNGLAVAIRAALDDTDPDRVQTLWSDACGLAGRDETQELSLAAVFGSRRPAACGQAGRLGHLGTASGAVEAAFLLESLRRGRVPGASAVDTGPGSLHMAVSGSLAGSRAAVLFRAGAPS